MTISTGTQLETRLRLLGLLLVVTFGAACTERPPEFPASGNSEKAGLFYHAVFAVGPLFLTYDSTARDSALWLVRPAALFMPFEVRALVRWNEVGRVVWSLTGPASADLLIELAPEGNHRLAIVRATCTVSACSTTTQERGLPAGARLFVSPGGSALLLTDDSLTNYDSIADLMRNTGARRTPRLSPPSKNELVGQSRDTTIVLTDLKSFSGEMIEGKNHSLFHLTLDAAGDPVAVAWSDGLQLLVDGAGRTQLWDCPASVLKGSAECTAYTAPSSFPRAGPVTIKDDECGLAMSRSGWTWLVRRIARTEDLFPAAGIVRCGANETVVYRARQIASVKPASRSVTSERRTVEFKR